jgi:hypothetical protein
VLKSPPVAAVVVAPSGTIEGKENSPHFLKPNDADSPSFSAAATSSNAHDTDGGEHVTSCSADNFTRSVQRNSASAILAFCSRVLCFDTKYFTF